ncbi:hypothetical protein GNY06_09980 [Elizabethkingia argentiflava]|uniref:Molecular chaperone GroES n=1 Tax=Elizabethkingia argenteiflava TaxID=2681556 RepID=A0A845PZ14_9FLAO|nr:hypothetical protein [Elizabethkingia argenteiflava]NAW51687.1 hypothetical protein [Elizabethkingia argenteiflava]
MKHFFFIFFLYHCIGLNAQWVGISKMLNIHDNKDKHFYRIENTKGAEYLGEIEVKGLGQDDVNLFRTIYTKAKKMGANAFHIKALESIDGSLLAFNPEHYYLSLYYLPMDVDTPTQGEDTAYIIASPTSAHKISINNEKFILPARTFKKISLKPGDIYTLSTLKFLGSSIKLSSSGKQSAHYFQVSGFKIKSNPYGKGGMNLKSGDFTRLEKSYAMFLTSIYQEIK